MKKINLFFACLLTMCVLTAKAQYANMPEPIITKNVSAFTATKLSFSPDSRYLAAEYKDILEKELTTIIEVATGQEVTASKAGYPWTETKSSAYEIVDDYETSKNPELCIKEKATGKKVYGVDVCMREGNVCSFGGKYLTSLSANNNIIAFFDTNNEDKKRYISLIASKAEVEFGYKLRGMISDKGYELTQEDKEYLMQKEQDITNLEKILIQLGDKIAQIEVFRISELPKYKSFIMPTIKIPKEISVDDCFCGEYMKISRNEGDTINYKFKYGIASRSKIIIEPKYESVELVGEKYASIKQNGKYSFIELATGKEIVTNLENSIIEYYSGYISYITNDYEPVTMNLATYQKFPFVIESELEEINAFLVMNIDDENSVMDKKGNLLIPFYSGMRDGTKNFQFVVKNAQNLWGVVGKQAASILPFEYQELGSYFSEGLIPAVKNKKLGYVNAKNQIVIPFQYDYKDFFKEKAYFNNGKAQVELNGKSFYINKTGKCVEGCN